MSAMSDVYSKARREIIALFRWDADKLSPDQTLRLDCAVALRLALDDLQGRIVRGESIDVAKMLTAADALSRLLPPAALAAPPEEANTPDPRQIMLDTYMGMRKRGELFDPCSTYEGMKAEVERLRARVAELEAAGAPAPDAGANAPGASGGGNPPPSGGNPPAGNVVPLKPPPAGAAASPAAPRTWDETENGRRWQEWHDAGGGGGYDRWSNQNW